MKSEHLRANLAYAQTHAYTQTHTYTYLSEHLRANLAYTHKHTHTHTNTHAAQSAPAGELSVLLLDLLLLQRQ
jgi:hypothetical protein